MKYPLGIVSALLLIILAIFILTLSVAQPTSPERKSPQNWLKEYQIHVYQDKVILSLENVQWARVTNTNSMDPLLDEESNVLLITPKNPESIATGDIIAYSTPQGTIIHRVIQRGHDQKGIYYITQGDNALEQDQDLIRFTDIQGVVMGVLY